MTQIWDQPPRIPAISDNPLGKGDQDRKLLLEDDLFGLAGDLAPAFDMIRHRHSSLPFCIGIYGSWGTGKSTAMYWLELALQSWNTSNNRTTGRNDASDNDPEIETIWFYPWKYETKESVWRGLISEVIMACLDSSPNKKDFTDLFEKFGEGAVDFISGIKGLSGVRKAVDHAKDYVKPHAAFLNTFESTFKDWVQAVLNPIGKDPKRLVIFIDDLDRCQPDVALQVLEALKLYLNIPHLVFVAGVDDRIIKDMISKEYEDLGVDPEIGRNYLAKMFQFEIHIGPDHTQAEKYLESLSATVWKNLGIEDSNLIDAYKRIILKIGDRNPREIKRLVSFCAICAYMRTNNPDSDIPKHIQSRLFYRQLGKLNSKCQTAYGTKGFHDFLESWTAYAKLNKDDTYEPYSQLSKIDSHAEEQNAKTKLTRALHGLADHEYLKDFRPILNNEILLDLLRLGILDEPDIGDSDGPDDGPDPTPTPDPHDLFAYIKSTEERDPAKAKLLYQNAVKEFPQNIAFLGSYANFLKGQDELKDAERFYQKALDIDPQHPITNGNYANCLAEQKRMDEAEIFYLKALEIEPENAVFNGNYANFLRKQGRMEEAEKFFLKALEIEPKHANNIGNYANFLRKRGRMEEAEKFYLKALEIEPKHANNIGNYADFLREHGRMEEAEKFFLKALKIEPEAADFNGNYANFLAAQRHMEEAEKFYLKALEIEPENAIINGNYANFLNRLNRLEEAEKFYLKALEIEPKHVNNIGNYANFLTAQRRMEEAEKFYLKALEIEPKNANTNGNYAGFLLAQNRKTEAKPYLEKAQELSDRPDLDLELRFYYFVHSYDEAEGEGAEHKMQQMLDEGIRSLDFDLSAHVRWAQDNKHPRLEDVKRYADAIGTKAP